MQTPLRLALVSAFPPGMQSLNEYGYHLARELVARDDVAEVIVLADRLETPAPELDLGPKLRVRRCWSFNSLATTPRLLHALRAERVDAVLWNLQTASFGDREATAGLGLLAPMLARHMGLPSGIIAHNIVAGVDLETTALKGQRLRQAIVRAGGRLVTGAMMGASYTTVTLRSYAEHLQQCFPRADVSLVPHGTFDRVARPLRPLAERPRRIVTMGKFGTYKRLETLLAAFDILRRDPAFADHELVIGGTDHPNTPGYMAETAAARAGDAGVTFAGYVAEEDVPSFFEEARLSVFDYSATTGSSGVLHQTASFGAVPVFPHIGDFVDVCRDEGLSGANYAPGDAAGMAEAMARLLGNLDAAEEIAAWNLTASQEIPLSSVAGFHVEKLRGLAAPQPEGELHPA